MYPHICLVQGATAQGNPVFREHTSRVMDTPNLKYSHPNSFPTCFTLVLTYTLNSFLSPISAKKKKKKNKKSNHSMFCETVNLLKIWDILGRYCTIFHHLLKFFFSFYHFLQSLPLLCSNSVCPSTSQERLRRAAVQNHPQTSGLRPTFTT